MVGIRTMAVDEEPNTLDRKAIEKALRESERRYRDLIEGSIQGVLIHVDSKPVFANQAYADIFGYDSPEEILAQQTACNHVAAHEHERMEQFRQARLRGEDIPAYEFEGVKKDGTRIWVENRGRVITWDGKPAIQRSIVDVTERKQAQENLRAAEEQNRLILQSAGEGIYGLDLEGNTTFVNPAAAAMLGYEVDELIGKLMHHLIHHTYPDGTRYPLEKCPMYAALTDGKTHVVTDEVLWRKDGSSFPVEYTSTPVRKDHEIVGAVVVFKDITERKRAEEELQKLAITDPLTGLPNRRHYLQIAEKETAWSLRYKHPLSVVVMDLDYFKEINDLHGHAKGDEVLVEVARVCLDAVRGSDVFARFGGEEFAALLPMTTLSQSEALGHRLRHLVSEAGVKSDEGTVRVTASFGVAQFVAEDESIEQTLARGDKALYQAKEAGRNRVRAAESEKPKK
ncbi:MAG: diguanylate cyclase [Gammaproteobacteria bacterium]|nr:diguanylate cyclase [Gammaproteobacteria bacterium]